MQCSYAYKIANSKYIFCDIEGTPTSTSSNEAIAPYLCIYQNFPPLGNGNIANTVGWQDCPKLQEAESHEKTVLVADWVADGTYEDYPYRAAIPMQGATTDNFPYVEFQQNEQESGNYADVCMSYDGGVYIFCKEIPSTAITVFVYLFIEDGDVE